MKTWYIYKITNLINGKAYVGQRYFNGDPSKDKYFGSGIALKKAIQKYGIENFTKEIIHKNIETKKRADIAEIFEIWNQCTFGPNGYNLTIGGDGWVGNKHSEESKKKISEYTKNMSEETKKKMSDAWKRRPMVSEETKKKMSEAAKNRPLVSEETKKKMSEAAKNRPPISDETRKKLSDSHKKKNSKINI